MIQIRIPIIYIDRVTHFVTAFKPCVPWGKQESLLTQQKASRCTIQRPIYSPSETSLEAIGKESREQLNNCNNNNDNNNQYNDDNGNNNNNNNKNNYDDDIKNAIDNEKNSDNKNNYNNNIK